MWIMQLQVLQEDLTKALTTAIRFTSVRSTLPILSNFKLTASKTKLTIEATNLEMSISTAVGGNIQKEGSITLPGNSFQEIIANLNPGQVILTLDKDHLKIENASFQAIISTIPANDFPKIPDSLNLAKSFTIPRSVLHTSFSKVLFSSSLDETRPILTGILFMFDNTKLNLVASDGFRLSKKQLILDKSLTCKNIVVPRSALLELIKLTGNSPDFIFEPKEDDNQLVIKTPEAIISTRLIDGNFPDFERIIPTSSPVKLTLDSTDLLKSLKIASVFAKEGNVVKFKVLESSLEIASENASLGSQTSSIEAKVEGLSSQDPFEISFNYKYIEDFLAVVGDSVDIKLTDSMSAAIFIDPQDPEFLHLIMPVRVQN